MGKNRRDFVVISVGPNNIRMLCNISGLGKYHIVASLHST